jgi:hypothetical protein
MTSRTVLILAGVLLFQTLVVALVLTPRPHSGGDNAGYVSLAYSLLERGAYLELWDPAEPPHTKYPPVFPVLLAGVILAGAKGWVGLKLVPAFSTVLAVGFAFLWARERRGAGVGVAVAVLLGLSSAAVYYSQWVLSDPTFLALTMGALWMFERAGSPSEAGERTGNSGKGANDEGHRGGDAGPGSTSWLAAGTIMILLAYLTRSAGLPLAVAAALWLAHRRRWRALWTFGVVFGVPAFLWWVRGYVVGGSEYVSEFWLVDPYRPFLGTVGPVELVRRVGENIVAYVGGIVPSGIVGQGRPFLPALGVGLLALWLLGWVRALREYVGVPELFFPLYFGLILLWPTPWSGDRFALPLFPLMFFYAGTALLWLLGPLGERARGVILLVLATALAVPMVHHWSVLARDAWTCRDATRAGEPGLCLHPAEQEYFALAQWSGEHLPDGSVVVTRKPRIFYLMSGMKGLSIPLTQDPDEFLRRARDGGAEYLTLDLLDSMSQYYVLPVLQDRLASVCAIVEEGSEGEMGTRILGILDQGEADEEGDPSALYVCPGEVLRGAGRGRGVPDAWDIPLLVLRAGGS